MEKKATEKQLAYAKRIAEATGKIDILNNFPETMDEISTFISMFEKEYVKKRLDESGSEEPTVKQIKFAEVIYRAVSRQDLRQVSEEIEEDFKALKTKADYSGFISKYRPTWEEMSK